MSHLLDSRVLLLQTLQCSTLFFSNHLAFVPFSFYNYIPIVTSSGFDSKQLFRSWCNSYSKTSAFTMSCRSGDVHNFSVSAGVLPLPWERTNTEIFLAVLWITENSHNVDYKYLTTCCLHSTVNTERESICQSGKMENAPHISLSFQTGISHGTTQLKWTCYKKLWKL